MQIAFDTQVTTALSIPNLKPYIINNEFNVKPACYIHPSVQILELSSLHFSFTQCSLLQGKDLLFFLARHHHNPISRQTICFRLRQNKYILQSAVQSHYLSRLYGKREFTLSGALFVYNSWEREIQAIFTTLMVKPEKYYH